MKAVLVVDGQVRELFQDVVDGVSLAERYAPALIEQMIEAPDQVQPGWTYADGQWSPPPGPPLDALKAHKEDMVWAAIRAEMDKHYDQPWQQAASQVHAHYKDLLARDDVPQAVKDQITPVLGLFVQLWQYLLVGSSMAGSSRVAQIRALTTPEEVTAYQVDLSGWVATDPQISMSQITVPAALAILPTV
ncbi:MAG: hypothetical protein HY794_13265 [Desulfarculus sp.]|nr:hypothetical protein [Desulfarculus sp.]